MTQNDNDTAQNPRKPGRPKGSVQYPEDELVLKKIADDKLDQQDASFAELARKHGLKSGSETRRVRDKWNKQSHTLLEDARLRRDKALELGPLGLITYWVGEFSGFIDRIAQALPIDEIQQSIDKANRKQAALKELKLSPEPPFDIDSGREIKRAIERFEARGTRTAEELAENLPPDMKASEMPASLRLYFMALMLFEYSENARKKEEAARPESDASDEVSK